MCIDRKKEIELNVFDQFYVFRGTERKHERCRFQKIEAWDGRCKGFDRDVSAQEKHQRVKSHLHFAQQRPQVRGKIEIWKH